MLPQHIALIIDGNRRWARANNTTLPFAYNEGLKTTVDIVWGLRDIGIKEVTIFTLSGDNLQRSKEEIEYILKKVDMFVESAKKLRVNVKFFGSIKKERVFISKNSMNVNVALGYSSREDILTAVAKSKGDKEKFMKSLKTSFLPPLDMLIRSGGYQRLSDFMLFEVGYTELFFINKLWPDVKIEDINDCIERFQKIKRNFGV